MAYPPVTILWLNYNSMRIIDVVKESLLSVLSLDYPDYEVIVIDNASTDGSYEVIRELAERAGGPRVRFIRMGRNVGFTAANNEGFRARSRNSKYVVLVNNDAAPYPESLRELVELVEGDSDRRVGAAQGIITTWDGSKIDNMGFVIDELLFAYPIHRHRPPHTPREPLYCTYASGAYSIYSVKAVLEATGREALFDDHMFAYFDDKVLGMRLWNTGYRVKAYPVISARHYGSASFGKISATKLYLMTRAYAVLTKVTKGLRYRPVIKLGFPLRQLGKAITSSGSVGEAMQKTYGVVRALLTAGEAASLISYSIDLPRVLTLRTGLGEAFRRVLAKIE